VSIQRCSYPGIGFIDRTVEEEMVTTNITNHAQPDQAKETLMNQRFDTLDVTHDAERTLTISLVVPCFNEEAVLPELLQRLQRLTDALEEEAWCRCEMVLVDDGSRDRTWPLVVEASASDSRIRGSRLSRNFGHQAALTCGYSIAAGDAIVCLDADLQDPPEVVREMVQRWREGADVVYGVRRSRDGETWFKLATAKCFYRIIRAGGAGMVKEDCGDFRLLSRRALDALLKMPERHRFLRGMVGWIGFEVAEVRYHRQSRAAGETKYPLRKMLRFAGDAILSFSRLPLCLPYVLAFVTLIVGMTAGVVLTVAPVAVSQTALLTAVILFCGAAQLVSLGLLGEYLGRIFEQVQHRPLYVVQEVTHPHRIAKIRVPSVPSPHEVSCSS
jgi:dolichol-phosphate mannosyltransferase